MAGCGERAQQAASGGSTAAGDPAAGFLGAHWARPLAGQGVPPAGFTPQEASLHPQDCGACHQDQYRDWSRSLHSRAMGPGLLGQLVNMDAAASDEHQDCIRCHAPLKEQAQSLAASLADPPRKTAPGADIPPLHTQGLVCAACHVRGHRVYGPKRRDGSVAEAAGFPHGGWIASSAFEDSRFCAACHQFEKDGFALNGKLLENTHEEWKASRHAREGRSCQSCHMPDRRHLWRGIHDPGMTKQGIEVSPTPLRIEAGQVIAALRIKNTGAGHYFPTYVTPQVIVRSRQETAAGEILKNTAQDYVIGRRVTQDLSREVFDTRLAPDEERSVEYRMAAHPRAAQLVFEIRVEPDAFYTEFYRSLLRDGGAGKGKTLIEAALKDSLASHYTVYTLRQPLADGRR